MALAKRQAGVTLVETMISLALSMIVTGAMVVLMGNSMGSANRIIKMSQLTDEMRNTMSMMTRDVRRANYNPYALYCYSNADCGVDDTTVKVNFLSDLDTVAYSGNSCLRYFLQREDGDFTDPDPGSIGGGGFRLVTESGVGRIEMWTGDHAPPADCGGGVGACPDDSSNNCWLAVTDPGFVNITGFTADEESGSFTDTLLRDDGSVMLTHRVRQVQVSLQGRLIIDDDIQREIVDIIRVRNDFIQGS